MKTQKTVQVLASFRFKNVARLCFEVLSSNGTDRYHTCFQGDGRESCTCKAHGNCYHLDGLRERAQAYFQSAKPVATYRANGVEHEVVKVGSRLVDSVVHDAEEIAAQAEVQAERKLEAFKAGMEAQYQGDPRRLSEAEETARAWREYHELPY